MRYGPRPRLSGIVRRWHKRMAIVYSKHYDISCFGLERLHPFDSRKYGRAWRDLGRIAGQHLRGHHIPVDRAANDVDLLQAHSADYLTRIRRSESLAAALEVPVLRHAPGWLLRWRVVLPMRWAVRGTVLAAKAALDRGWAANLSGGYHHAQRDRGEGFCLFSDIAIAVRQLRSEGLLRSPGRIAYVDLDAHQGNGVCHEFMVDREVYIFDMYNRNIYPARDTEARRRIDCDLPLPSACAGTEYLRTLRSHLPEFVDSISRSAGIALAIYNAGTDVCADDPLGGMALSALDILERDLFVMHQFRSRGIPVVMLPSGGYTGNSYRLIAASLGKLLEPWS
jgi:histone deacetylase 11